MTFEINLLIRKTIFKGGKTPSSRLQSNIRLQADSLSSPFAFIRIVKGIGRDADIGRHEHAFVKFLLANYGVGKYTVLRADGKFKSFWNGYLENDRFIREKGKISPYLKSLRPRQWHPIIFNRDTND